MASKSRLCNLGLWGSMVIKYLAQIVEGGQLKPNQTLRAEHQLPTHMIFRYMQLSHAFQAQFQISPLDISQSTLERYLRQPGLQKAIAWIYAILLKPSGSHLERLRLKWKADIPAMDEEAWKGVIEQIP
ncbi:hypothetical protein XELAEV_18025190mg [Xenopus laevis]|uniref:Uncharacterized protein n=1 Tax=Xenopus laevis TaxID=8355 RepID=A0A974D194_XENLA|nr:hypothetical protein XELAEV_18025190mg [Xenopus laevis]